ncbi:GGDEF domain-containing protein [Roseobacter sp. CCS2]|uniref:GGDEF domain-containing protein n=1 Tax=Roseobacter sp. CCS2 TaxID=391593 RepID=UPI00031DCD45|nr:diguanylate cyclase [Roseobacter sp. CCS2]
MLQIQVLIPPIVALLGMAFLFNAVLRKFYDSTYQQVAFGILFGTVVAMGMTNPLSLGDGLIFDTRTLLVGAAVAFVGPLAGLITLGIGLVCRILIGGTGMGAGIVGLILAFGLAYLWTVMTKGRIKNLVLHDVFLGLAITLSAVAFFVLPYELAMTLFLSVLPTLLFVNVVGMVVIGLVFRHGVHQLRYTEQLINAAKTDSLTNLLNRRGMDEEIGATQYDRKMGHAMFYFDIDNFKYVNDTYGHGAGDAALAIVAARIKDSVRGEALFTRHGGDEFSIYMPRLEAADVRHVADRLCACVSNQAFGFDSHTFDVSISIGAIWTKQNLPPQKMIDLADAQLLLAKQAGKNRAQVAYDNQQGEAAVA